MNDSNDPWNINPRNTGELTIAEAFVIGFVMIVGFIGFMAFMNWACRLLEAL